MPTAGYAYAPVTATDQSGLGRSGWVQCRITSPAVLAWFPSLPADSQRFALSTSAEHQHSSLMSLSKVLVWVSRLEIGLADWVPRVLRGVCRLADYPRELKGNTPVKELCL